MTHTRTELEALTAKALRPIAADLGITGASRMTKDTLISAIIAAEDTEAAKDACDVADFDEEAVYAQAVKVVPSEQDLPEIPEPAPGAVSIPLPDLNVTAESTKQDLSALSSGLEYYARATRHGVETVLFEESKRGRVKYRVVNPKTGDVSAPYGMREKTFRRDYTLVQA